MSVAIVAVLETVKLVKNPVIAVRIFEKRLVEVALDANKLVAEAFSAAKLLVTVAFVAIRSPNVPFVPLIELKELEPAIRLAIVAVASLVSPDTVRSVIVVVARVEVPVTASVPPTVSFPVTVDVPTVELMKLELTAKILRNLLVIEPREYVLERTGIISARRLIVLKNVDSPVTASVPDALRLPVVESCEAVVVARVTVLVAVRVPVTRLVVVALAAVKSCTYAVIALKSVAKRLDEVALVRDAFSEKRLVEVALVTRVDEALNVAPFVRESESIPDL